MTKNSKALYRQRYKDGLKAHIGRSPNRRLTSRVARSLGRDGLALGLNIFDLVRVHDQATAAQLRPVATSSNPNGENPPTPEGSFLFEAMKPFEEDRINQDKSAGQAKLLGLKQLAQEALLNEQLLADSKRLKDELQRLTYQLLIAQEEDRKEVSRELHEEVAQILTGINIRLAALKETGAKNNRELKKDITRTQHLVEKSVRVVNQYALKLRPAMLDDLGLIPALRSFIKDLQESKGLQTRFTAFPEVETLNSIQRTVLFRVAQEALINVTRHAHAQLATVCIEKFATGVRLIVHDDGKGFSVDRIMASKSHKRLGLLGMRERVEMSGGTLSIISSPATGTTLRAEIPFNPPSIVKV